MSRSRNSLTNPRGVFSGQQVSHFVVVNLAHRHFQRVALLRILALSDKSVKETIEAFEGSY